MQDFLRLLAQYQEAYLLNEGIERNPNYEDLYGLLKQIQRWLGRGAVKNPAVGPFVDQFERITLPLRYRYSAMRNGGDGPTDLLNFAALTCSFIEWVVQWSLKHDGAVEGMGLIVQLARDSRVGRLDIVTLNHDTLVEDLLAAEEILFADGFEGEGPHFKYESPGSLFTTDCKIRIIKLHGSIDWRMVAQTGLHKWEARLAKPFKKNALSGGIPSDLLIMQSNNFLTGYDKDLYYHSGLTAAMHDLFHESLRAARVLIASGYGWGDWAVNARLKDWLLGDPNNRLLLLHSPDDPVEPRLRNAGLAHFLAEGQIEVHGNWMSGVLIHDIEHLVFR